MILPYPRVLPLPPYTPVWQYFYHNPRGTVLLDKGIHQQHFSSHHNNFVYILVLKLWGVECLQSSICCCGNVSKRPLFSPSYKYLQTVNKTFIVFSYTRVKKKCYTRCWGGSDGRFIFLRICCVGLTHVSVSACSCYISRATRLRMCVQHLSLSYCG